MTSTGAWPTSKATSRPKTGRWRARLNSYVKGETGPMDPEVAQIFNFIMWLVPFIALIVALGVAGATLNNWLKIKNGYPLSNSWGMPLHPKRDEETTERVRL